jgi:carbonic anhydrase
MTGLNCARILEKAQARGISRDVIATLQHAGVDLERWLVGFDQVEDGVVRSVELIGNHPLLPADVAVHGMLIDPVTGKLELVRRTANAK